MIAAWLRGLGLERYTQAFEDNDVDAQLLRKLTESDLADIGVKSVGHRRKLVEAINALGEALPVLPAATHEMPARARAEHRQLSVLCCDMVGSTALSDRLDAEDLRDVIREFHGVCTRLVSKYEGHVANFIGDSVLAYFGWPRAQEDDAERAVLAGLAMARAVSGLSTPTGECLAVRVGVATGVVVVGDSIQAGSVPEQSAVGAAPQRAAQLQSLVSPGRVVIDEVTKRLLGSGFELHPLGSHEMRGEVARVVVYAVAGQKRWDSRFDARKGQEVTPMVGRDQELSLLLERWAQARGGEGAVVMLVGEAGIGKSRLIRAVLDTCAAQVHWRVRWQCSPHHTGSALWPVIQRLERTAGLELEDSNEAALDKLEALMCQDQNATALFATMLGLNASQRYGPLEMTPQMLRERTMELLVEQMLELTEQRPLLLVVEDAHWIDPTTLELLDRCLERIDGARMLVLITSRPDNPPALGARPSVTRLSLNRLSRASVEAIVAELGGNALQAQTLATIVAQTDGVPLFVEELTKALLETGEATIPASLYGSLMARLDLFPEVKEVAQIAACIGREFDVGLLAAVCNWSHPELSDAIDRLMSAQIIVRRGDPGRGVYSFRHALLQDAAYESLLRSTVRRLNARILEVLESAQLQLPAPPHLLAHYARRAGLIEKSVEQWGLAGMAALSKSAYLEAANHLATAIELIRSEEAPAVDWRPRELRLQIALGQARMAAFGYGADVTRQSFERARELLDIAEDKAMRVPVVYGLWVENMMTGRPQQALRMSMDLLVAAQADDDEQTKLVAHRLVGSTHLERGELTQARAHLERALQIHDGDLSRYRNLSALYGMDPGASACGNLAVVLHAAGLSAQAMKLAERVRSMAQGVAHAIARAPMYCECVNLAILRQDMEWIERDGEVFTQLAIENGLALWRAYAVGMGAWKSLLNGRPAEAVKGFRRCIDELTRYPARVRIQLYQLGLAVALGQCSRDAEAMHTVDVALQESAQAGQYWLDAELWRVRGELIRRAASKPGGLTGLGDFERALEVARAQGALAWELRAAMSLARLWAERDEPTRGLDLLASVYSRFTEGFDTTDLAEARTLLGTIAASSSHQCQQGVDEGRG